MGVKNWRKTPYRSEDGAEGTKERFETICGQISVNASKRPSRICCQRLTMAFESLISFQ